MKKPTAPWVRKAEADFQLAKQTLQGPGRFHDNVCFHCQQSAEKYLKALLVELGITPPRIRDLDQLLTMLSAQHGSLRSMRRGLLFLSEFAVETRYPGLDATKRQAKAAFHWAERVRDAIRPILGIKVKKQKKGP